MTQLDSSQFNPIFFAILAKKKQSLEQKMFSQLNER